jgi:hypothetical protein
LAQAMASNSQSFDQRTIRHEHRLEINFHLNLIFKLQRLQTVRTFFKIRSCDFSRKKLITVSLLPVDSYRSRKVWLLSHWKGPSPSCGHWRAEHRWSRRRCRLSNKVRNLMCSNTIVAGKLIVQKVNNRSMIHLYSEMRNMKAVLIQSSRVCWRMTQQLRCFGSDCGGSGIQGHRQSVCSNIRVEVWPCRQTAYIGINLCQGYSPSLLSYVWNSA